MHKEYLKIGEERELDSHKSEQTENNEQTPKDITPEEKFENYAKENSYSQDTPEADDSTIVEEIEF